MCNRFAQYTDDLEQDISTTHPYLDVKLWHPEDEIGGWLRNLPLSEPRYNVIPKDVVRILYRWDKQDLLRPMKWGIPKTKPDSDSASAHSHWEEKFDWIPHVQDVGIADGKWDRFVIPEDGTHSLRCIIPVNGYFGLGPPPPNSKSKKRVPYYVKYKDGGTMFLAGLWDAAKLKGNYIPIFIFTIITTSSSSSQLEILGDRMPAILEKEEDITRWLRTEDYPWNEELQEMLRSYEEDRLEFFQVPPDVLSKTERYNNPSCIVPIAQRKDSLVNAFKRQAERPKKIPPEAEGPQPEASGSGSSKRPFEVVSEDEQEDEPRTKKRVHESKEVAVREKKAPEKKKGKKKGEGKANVKE